MDRIEAKNIVAEEMDTTPQSALHEILNFRLVELEQRTARMTLCQACPHYSAPMCNRCGCFSPIKTFLQSARCPIGEW